MSRLSYKIWERKMQTIRSAYWDIWRLWGGSRRKSGKTCRREISMKSWLNERNLAVMGLATTRCRRWWYTNRTRLKWRWIHKSNAFPILSQRPGRIKSTKEWEITQIIGLSLDQSSQLFSLLSSKWPLPRSQSPRPVKSQSLKNKTLPMSWGNSY